MCNNNQFRRSFVYWIIDNLKKDKILDGNPIIKNGIKRKLTDEEQSIFDSVRGHFFDGSDLSFSMKDESLMKKILSSTFLKEYFLRACLNG